MTTSVVAISAGHHPGGDGGLRKGASFRDFNEYDEAVFWAAEIVRRMGPQYAVLVPTGPLQKKIKFINEIPRCAAAVEIHFNAAHDGAGRNVGRGFETLYMPGSHKGLILAKLLHTYAIAPHFSKDRGVKEGWYRMRQDLGPDFFLRETDPPAVILEPGFVQHAAEIRERRADCCGSIAAVLTDYLSGDVR